MSSLLYELAITPRNIIWRMGRTAGLFAAALGVLAASAVLAEAQSPSCPCEASAPVKAALKDLDSPDLDRLPFRERKEKRLAILKRLRQKYPGDIFIERLYMEESSSFGTYDPFVIEEYRGLAGSHPNDPAFAYLYARSLIGTNTADAIDGFEKTLRLAPGFAWANLGLVSIYDQKQFEDRTKMTANLKAFMRNCPNSLEGSDYLRSVADVDFARKAAADIRARLQRDSVVEDVSRYLALWQLEFRVAPVQEHQEARNAVIEDLTRLKLNASVTGSLRGLWVIKQGCKLAGDKEGQHWADDQLIAKFPGTTEASQISDERWQISHPWPSADDPQEKKTKFYQALLERADGMIKQRADDQFAWLFRLEALSELKDHQRSELLETGDHLARALELNEGSLYFSPPVLAQVAKTYLDNNVGLDRVPALVEGGMKHEEVRFDRELKSDLLSLDAREHIASDLESCQWYGWTVLAGAYLKMNQNDKARDVIGKMSESVSVARAEEISPADKPKYKQNQSTYWEWKGRLAEAEGHKVDALGFYQHALAVGGKNLAAPASDESRNDDSVTARTTRLWKELGGSAEGLEALTAPAEEPADVESTGDWERRARRLPAFDLADVKGKHWSLADLKGKVVFVNIWATWCGPCRMELPLFQKLYDRVKDRKDVLALTFNIDQNPGVIEPFLKENAFTFPVLPALSYVENFFTVSSIPRSWIVTADGTLREERVGFEGDPDKWVDDAIKEMEKAKTN